MLGVFPRNLSVTSHCVDADTAFVVVDIRITAQSSVFRLLCFKLGQQFAKEWGQGQRTD